MNLIYSFIKLKLNNINLKKNKKYNIKFINKLLQAAGAVSGVAAVPGISGQMTPNELMANMANMQNMMAMQSVPGMQNMMAMQMQMQVMQQQYSNAAAISQNNVISGDGTPILPQIMPTVI